MSVSDYLIIGIGTIIDWYGGWYGTELIAHRQYWSGGCVIALCGTITFACLKWVW